MYNIIISIVPSKMNKKNLITDSTINGDELILEKRPDFTTPRVLEY